MQHSSLQAAKAVAQVYNAASHARVSEALARAQTSLGLQVGFLYWDGHVSQKSFKKDHTEKAEAIWRTVAGDTSKLTRQVSIAFPNMPESRQPYASCLLLILCETLNALVTR